MSFENYGRYQLLKRLATGGMAEIFLARKLPPGKASLELPTSDEQLLVVKRILSHLAENADFVRMFLDEARIAARLHHPNVVQVFDLGAEGDTYFIAMEYIHGEDVRRVWKRAESQGMPMSAALACRVVAEACRGLRYAHKKGDAEGRPLGIVHRDVSPQNILVTFQGGVKVVDFGIAKATDQTTATRSGVLKGKYSYMSPEQAQGKRLDARSDIFALGVILWELLTGTRLFKRASDMQTLDAVIQCDVAPPSSVNPELPSALDAILLRALERDPARRYQKASELQRALEAWLEAGTAPASTGDLAAFMQQVYAERLAQEASAGRLVLEEPPLSAGPNELFRAEAGVAKLIPEMPRSDRAGGGQELGLLEASEREELSAMPTADARAVAGPSLSTVDEGRQGPLLPRRERIRGRRPREGGEPSLIRTIPLGLWLGLGAFVVAGLVALYLLPGNPPPARVILSTIPPGATLVFDGRVRLKTPTFLPRVPAGTYPLQLTAPGYRERTGRVHIPPTGDVSLDPIRLEPVQPARAEMEPGSDAGAGPMPEPPAQPEEVHSGAGEEEANVAITVTSIPAGARVRVNGSPSGHTPLTLRGAPRTAVQLLLDKPGYAPLATSLEFGTAAEERSLRLEERRSGSAHRAPPRAAGLVRFVVKPLGAWAEVSCDGKKLGTTPLRDQRLPAGVYECEFINPDLGARRQRVEVRPRDTTRVTVNF